MDNKELKVVAIGEPDVCALGESGQQIFIQVLFESLLELKQQQTKDNN